MGRMSKIALIVVDLRYRHSSIRSAHFHTALLGGAHTTIKQTWQGVRWESNLYYKAATLKRAHISDNGVFTSCCG